MWTLVVCRNASCQCFVLGNRADLTTVWSPFFTFKLQRTRMTVPFTHVTHTTVDYPCQTGSHPLETLSLISAGGDRWVELAGGGGGGLSCNEGRLGSDISATCIWAYPQYQRGRLESDIQARTKEAATHWSAGDSPDGNLLFSHEGWVGPYTDFELGWRRGRVLLTPGSMDFTHTAPPSQGTGEWHDVWEVLGSPSKKYHSGVCINRETDCNNQ